MIHSKPKAAVLPNYQPISDAHFERVKKLLDLHTTLENEHQARESVEAAHTLECVYTWPSAPFFFKALDVFQTWKGHDEVVKFYHHLYDTVIDVQLEILHMVVSHEAAYNYVRITGWAGAAGHKIPLLPKLTLHSAVIFPYDHEQKLFVGEHFYFGTKSIASNKYLDGPTRGINEPYTPTPASIGMKSYEAMRLKARDAWMKAFNIGAKTQRGFLKTMADNLTDDASLHLYPGGHFHGRTYSGKEAVLGFYRDLFDSFQRPRMSTDKPMIGIYTIGIGGTFTGTQVKAFLGFAPKRRRATVALPGTTNYFYDHGQEKFSRITMLFDWDELGPPV